MTTIRDSLRAFRSLLFLAWVLPAAVGLYCLAVYGVVVRGHVIAPSYDRVLRIHEFLGSQAAPARRGGVYFLGSSVTVEGLDCDIVDRSLPGGVKSFNLGWTGAGPRQWLLIEPALEQSQPSVVVLCTGLGTIMQGADLREDMITLAGYWDFLPAEYLEQIKPLLTGAQYEQLAACRMRHMLALRSFPLEAADAYLQEVSRADLRYAGHTTNFKAPWVRRQSVQGEKRRRELQMQHDRLATMTSGQTLETSIRIVEFLVTRLRKQGCRPVILLDPMNPEAAAGLDDRAIAPARRALADLAGRTGATFWDHSGALDKPDDFADSVHPNSQGRTRWSALLGRDLAELSQRK